MLTTHDDLFCESNSMCNNANAFAVILGSKSALVDSIGTCYVILQRFLSFFRFFLVFPTDRGILPIFCVGVKGNLSECCCYDGNGDKYHHRPTTIYAVSRTK